MSRPDAATLYAALAEDLQHLTEKYRAMLPETFVGAGIGVADYSAGSLTVAVQEASQPLDASLAIAIALLRTVLESEANPQVSSLVTRAQRLVHTAIELKTGQLLATHSLH